MKKSSFFLRPAPAAFLSIDAEKSRIDDRMSLILAEEKMVIVKNIFHDFLP
jgi:hypothetical protein